MVTTNELRIDAPISKQHHFFSVTWWSRASKGRDKELGDKYSDRPCIKRAKLQLKTVCSNLPFEGGVDQDWGHVMLKSYYYVLGTNKLTALNVTFSLIKWN
uniref:Uncharacterized protein n=1 Tax=Timema tahoe TaxID=61484 RepID=A0A7R9IMF0_9NEOP|nr:unnamed protein product [Timema tahoe]